MVLTSTPFVAAMWVVGGTVLLLLEPRAMVAAVDAATASATTVIDNNSSETTKITDGVPAPFGKYPTFAIPDPDQGIYCGATLIWPDVVLTVAHCRKAFHYYGGTVYIGSHPRYSDSDPSLRNDIMRVFLNSISTVRPSPYNTNGTIPTVGQSATVIGHGLTTDQPLSVSNDLREGRVRIENFAACAGAYSAIIFNEEIVCVQRNPGQIYNGDSGGPLFDDATGAVMAVVSAGSPRGCFTPAPTVFARVSFHTAWIQSTLCALSKVKPANCTSVTPPFGPPTLDMNPIYDDNTQYDDDILEYNSNSCVAGSKLTHRRFLLLFCRSSCVSESKVSRRKD